jgi:archaellum component FlaF (FlaF/FlaG flagellin family)
LAALILSANPSLTNAQVLDIMTKNADDLGQPGFDPYYGYGRVNAYTSLQAALAAVPQPDVTAPSVALTAPENGSTVSGAVTVTVLATDDVGVESVSLYLNGTLFATASAQPYQFSWDTTNYPDGLYELLAIANDCAGNSGQSGSISVNVSNASNPPDDSAPTVAITSPADGSSVSRTTVKITVNASDNVGVSKLELYIDGALKTVTSQSYLSWSWNTRKEARGQHIISAKAYDQAGNVQTDAITVYKQ